ncbi:MAG: 50S ribosomal protein L4 [Candidatus Aenigmarchaeota archaeon]|nr:50S ribosomal protein L4 [Candidatus Aenigmarchaeota archaeon]MDI6722298.1 50S ribosomal protein L4 [Candidatus Aenigmarchaeota archaeon]
MKVKIYDLTGKETGTTELPRVFETPYRPDVIKRAVLAQQSRRRQKYGSDPLAGKRTSAHYHGRRKYRFTMMNKELSRIPRIHGKGAGIFAYRARFAPHAVKGRQAHPPKSEKNWAQRVNKKELGLAIKSGIAASAMSENLKLRGHSAPSPCIFVDDFENIKKAKQLKKLLENVMANEIKRTEKRKVRAGRGKMRNRRYSRKKGPLIVASKNCDVIKAAKNIPGIDAVPFQNLNAELLAPGGQAGRLLILTKTCLQKLDEKFGE